MNEPGKSLILVVDDNKPNLLTLESLLASRDRQIVTASNGNDALRLALNKSIDLIILDVNMPEMDGFEVAQMLKSNKKTRDIPIIFASAEKKEHQSMMKGFEEGAIDYLFKPLDPEIAKAKVNVLLKLQQQRKELIEKNISLTKSDLLINNSADIIGIIDVATLKVEEINTAFSTIVGYPLEEVRGSLITSFLLTGDIIPFQNYAKQFNGNFSFETRICCKDKTVKWLQWKGVEKNAKWFINARDITEIKHAEQIRTYLATLVKQSNDAIYIYNQDGQIISWNQGAEKIYGFSETEALNMSIWSIIPATMREEYEQTLANVLAGKQVQFYESQRVSRTGQLVDVLFSASVISAPGSEYKSIAITERDITQQKIAVEQIRQLNKDLQANVEQLEVTNKELEAFSYSVSHDLRAPLRALNGYSQIFQEDYGNGLDDEAKRLIGNIQDNARKMGLLIDDLLAFSKLGRKSIQKAPVDMNDLVRRVLDEINSSTNHNATIKADTLLPAQADFSLLHQVWMNLVSNAVKYSSKKSTPVVEIGSRKDGNEHIYFVKDNGAGFDMQYASKLFGVFQRLHAADEFEGTGIGLAIVQRIVAKHGGRVWAEAKKDEGATFYFTLPAEDTHQ